MASSHEIPSDNVDETKSKGSNRRLASSLVAVAVLMAGMIRLGRMPWTGTGGDDQRSPDRELLSAQSPSTADILGVPLTGDTDEHGAEDSHKHRRRRLVRKMGNVPNTGFEPRALFDEESGVSTKIDISYELAEAARKAKLYSNALEAMKVTSKEVSDAQSVTIQDAINDIKAGHFAIAAEKIMTGTDPKICDMLRDETLGITHVLMGCSELSLAVTRKEVDECKGDRDVVYVDTTQLMALYIYGHLVNEETKMNFFVKRKHHRREHDHHEHDHHKGG